MSSLQEALAAKKFVCTVELNPPKGASLDKFLALAQGLAGKADALVLADNPGATARMDPLLAAAKLSNGSGGEVVLTLTCRDGNRLSLTARMLAAAAAGVKNLLLVSGDHVSLGDHPQAKAVYDLDSVQALLLAGQLAQGHDLAGGELEDAPSFFAGAAVCLQAEPRAAQLMKLGKKVAAGAGFVITMPVDGADQFKAFVEQAGSLERPILAGVEVGEGQEPDAATALVKELEKAGAAGVHLSWPSAPERLPELLAACGR